MSASSKESTSAPDDPSVGRLLGNLARDTGALIRQEVQLASAEMSEKAKTAANNLALIAVGSLMALASLLALMTAATVALAMLLPLWGAALVVGALVGGASYALLHKGVAAVGRIRPLPARTIETLKQNVNWVKEEVQ